MDKLTVVTLESVVMPFPYPQELLEKFFGPDGSGFEDDFFSKTDLILSAFLEEISPCCSTKEFSLKEHVSVIQALLKHASTFGGNPHFIYYNDVAQSLEFQFEFETAGFANSFSSTLNDFISDSGIAL